MIPRFLQGILGIPRFRKPSFDVFGSTFEDLDDFKVYLCFG